MYANAAANNPLLNNTDKSAAFQEAGVTQSLGGYGSLSIARANARRNGTLLSSFPLVYSSFVSSLGTWFNNVDLPMRVRVKENSNFITWVECFGYELPDGEMSYEKLPDDVKKDLEAQWRDFVWRGIFPPGRTEVWNRHLKREKLKVERDQDTRRMRMLALPGWERLDTDPPEDMAQDSSLPLPTVVTVRAPQKAGQSHASSIATSSSALPSKSSASAVAPPPAFIAPPPLSSPMPFLPPNLPPGVPHTPQMMMFMMQQMVHMQQQHQHHQQQHPSPPTSSMELRSTA